MNLNRMPTRREVIISGVAAGAAATLAYTFGGTARVFAEDDSQQGSITEHLAVIHASDPSFEPEIDRLFPGLRKDSVFKSIQSHAVLIRNIGTRSIRAHSTLWTATTPTGTFKATRLHFFHPRGKHPDSVQFGVTGNKTRFTGKVPLLKPGATRLLTPYFNWSPKCYLKGGTPTWHKILNASSSRRRFFANLSNATDIQVSIDAVIFNRKHMIGKDSGHLGRMYRKSRNAEHDEAADVLRMIKSGASLEDAACLLHQHASQEVPKVKNGNSRGKDIYLSVRKRQAKVLLRRLKQANKLGKPEVFVKTLNYLKKQRKTVTGHRKKNALDAVIGPIQTEGGMA
jgi:hypothetical protein